MFKKVLVVHDKINFVKGYDTKIFKEIDSNEHLYLIGLNSNGFEVLVEDGYESDILNLFSSNNIRIVKRNMVGDSLLVIIRNPTNINGKSFQELDEQRAAELFNKG